MPSVPISRGRKTSNMNQIYFGISTPFSSLSLFTPSITAGLGYKGLTSQLMTVPPYAVACQLYALRKVSELMICRCCHNPSFLLGRSFQCKRCSLGNFLHDWCSWVPSFSSSPYRCLPFPLRMFNSSSIWSIFLYSPSPRLVVIKPSHYRRCWSCNRN